jgi:hypothetical protein
MSIINSDQFNTDWQLRVLKGLQSVSDKIAALGGGGSSITPVLVIPTVRKELNTQGLLDEVVKSISFASIGTANAYLSFDGGATNVTLKPGEVVNMDAGAVNNFYAANTFGWDTTFNPGAELLISYNK